MKLRFKLILVLCCNLVANSALSDEPGLFKYASDLQTEREEYPVQVISGLNKAAIGSVIQIEEPSGGIHDFRVDRITRHQSGTSTLTGISLNTDHRLLITHDQGEIIKGTFFLQPDNILILEKRVEGHVLLPISPHQLSDGLQDDFGIPPAGLNTNKKAEKEGTEATESSSDFSLIDLLVLHTPEVEDAVAKIDHMVETANLAFRDSYVSAEFRAVHILEVDYTNESANETAVRAMYANEAPFQGLENLRDEFGADLVLLVRPYDLEAQGSCGWAFLLGANGGNLDQPRWAYGTFNEGLDPVANRYCPDTILGHEAGHLMGSAHDLEHRSLSGKYSYSNGYGFEDDFGTVMSYYYPSLAKFSSPRISCNEASPCGISIGEPSEADNATSLNQTRATVANFRTQAVSLQIMSGLWGINNELATGQPGRGFQLVFQGRTLVLTYFGYDNNGEPLFYQASGAVVDGKFSANLQKFVGGTVLGESYKPATLVGDVGTVVLTFVNASNGTIQLPGEATEEISLFVFDTD